MDTDYEQYQDEERMFADMVSRDVKGQAEPEESAWIRQPENVDSLVRHLKTMKRNIEGQREYFKKNSAELLTEYKLGEIDSEEYNERLRSIARGRSNNGRVLTATEVHLLEAMELQSKREKGA